MKRKSHWVSKHFQDFEQDAALRSQTIAFLDDITCSPNLLPGEHRAASQLLRLLCRDDIENNQMHLEKLLTPPRVSGINTNLLLNFGLISVRRVTNWLWNIRWFRCRARKASKRYRHWKLQNKWRIWIIKYSLAFAASKWFVLFFNFKSKNSRISVENFWDKRGWNRIKNPKRSTFHKWRSALTMARDLFHLKLFLAAICNPAWQPLRSGRRWLIFAVVYIISMACFKCVQRLPMQPYFDWRKRGIKFRKRLVFIFWNFIGNVESNNLPNVSKSIKFSWPNQEKFWGWVSRLNLVYTWGLEFTRRT